MPPTTNSLIADPMWETEKRPYNYKYLSIKKAKQTTLKQYVNELKSLPFWIWDEKEHTEKRKELHVYDKKLGIHYSKCCFNHRIGLPYKFNKLTKQVKYNPLFDYEKQIIDAIEDTTKEWRNIWILKSRGLGITELILRYMVWLCVHDDTYRNTTMQIITGPRFQLAEGLIRRIKGLFYTKFPRIQFPDPRGELNLNEALIKAYPSHTVDTARGETDVSFSFIDEADFFPKGQQKDVRDVVEGYRIKSNPITVFVSTPKNPDGLMKQIEDEVNNGYTKIRLDFTKGIGKIYSESEIKKEKKAEYFAREYNLQYAGIIGNVFSSTDIERSLELGRRLELDKGLAAISNRYSLKSIGIDPGFGTSKFAIVLTQLQNGIIVILYADEFERPNFHAMIDKVWELRQRVGAVSNIFVDAANPEVWETLKREYNERYDYAYVQEMIAFCRKHNLDLANRMHVVPVAFGLDGPKMLAHAKKLLEDSRNIVAINPKLEKLIVALRTAVVEGEYKLNKEDTSYDDILDALRLALTFYKYKDQQADIW